MRIVEDYDVVDHGIEWPDYFPGCGVAFTKFDACFTGIGEDYAEAFEDALDGAAQCGWDVEHIISSRVDGPTVEDYYRENDIAIDDLYVFPYYHVSIRLKEAEPNLFTNLAEEDCQ